MLFADEPAPLAAGELAGLAAADVPAAPLFPDGAAADFVGVLDPAPLGNAFPPDVGGGVGGVAAFIKSLGTVTAGAEVCGAPSGEL